MNKSKPNKISATINKSNNKLTYSSSIRTRWTGGRRARCCPGRGTPPSPAATSAATTTELTLRRCPRCTAICGQAPPGAPASADPRTTPPGQRLSAWPASWPSPMRTAATPMRTPSPCPPSSSPLLAGPADPNRPRYET